MVAEFGMPLGAKWHHFSCSDWERQTTSLTQRTRHILGTPHHCASISIRPKFWIGGSRGTISSQSLGEGKRKTVSWDEKFLQSMLWDVFSKFLLCYIFWVLANQLQWKQHSRISCRDLRLESKISLWHSNRENSWWAEGFRGAMPAPEGQRPEWTM